MVWLKACPRCGGDVFETWVNGGVGAVCLQCGYELRAQEHFLLRRTGRARPEPVPVGSPERKEG